MKDCIRSAWVAGCVTAMLLTVAPVGAQDFEDWQNAELVTLAVAINEARQGQRAPDSDAITYLPSYFKGIGDDLISGPFSLLIDPAAVTAGNIAVYVAMAESSSDSSDLELSDLVFENSFYVGTGTRDGDRVSIASFVQAEGGAYDLYIAVRDSFDGDAPVERSLDPVTRQITQVTVVPPITILQERVTIPDLWTDELQIGSVLLFRDLQPLTEAPTPEDIAESPYLLTGFRVTPRLDADFRQQDELRFMFGIYNAGHDGGMPDITVSYDFHSRTADGDEFFNRTAPQQLGPQTLPPGFDVRQFPLVIPQNIPLGGFPAGAYRLEIKVTDNEEDTELTQDLLFSVADN